MNVRQVKNGTIFSLVVEDEGFPVDLVSDIGALIGAIHKTMHQDSKPAAAIFRMMIAGITHEGSPLWNVSDDVPGENEVPVEETKLNMRIVCCDNSGNDCFTIGKVYEIRDGWIEDDHGFQVCVKSLRDLCEISHVHMVELKE